ncbi:MAG: cytochrome c peroxidase [Bacteroidota bacterium]
MYINKRVRAGQGLFWLCLALLWLGACQHEDGAELDDYAFRQPTNFPEPTYTFDNNPTTKAGFELGRTLFFDPILSVDNTISCGSCHIQSLAFADVPLHPVSIGVHGRAGIRNAPGLANMAFLPEFFWDGGVTHLDFVPLNAVEAVFEMDETIENVIQKLNAHTEYPQRFREAFGVESVTTPFFLHALSQFMNRMISDQSKYDQYLAGEAQLTGEEAKGMALFEEKCATCHSGILFTDHSYRNNGISTDFPDLGRALITSFDGDIGKFKVPSLRNVGVTPPYMHNAKFDSLEEVLAHYASGVQESPSLDASLKQNEQLGIAMTEEEQAAIVAFLETLTDYEFLSDPLFRRSN